MILLKLLLFQGFFPHFAPWCKVQSPCLGQTLRWLQQQHCSPPTLLKCQQCSTLTCLVTVHQKTRTIFVWQLYTSESSHWWGKFFHNDPATNLSATALCQLCHCGNTQFWSICLSQWVCFWRYCSFCRWRKVNSVRETDQESLSSWLCELNCINIFHPLSTGGDLFRMDSPVSTFLCLCRPVIHTHRWTVLSTCHLSARRGNYLQLDWEAPSAVPPFCERIIFQRGISSENASSHLLRQTQNMWAHDL